MKREKIQTKSLFFESAVIFILTVLARNIFKMSLCVMPYSREYIFQWSANNVMDFLIIFSFISISWVWLQYKGLYLWSLVTFILAVINHYVVVLHNSPLTVQELSNIRTALNVLTSYKLKIDIYVVGIIIFFAVELVVIGALRYFLKTICNRVIFLSLSVLMLTFITIYVYAFVNHGYWSWTECYKNDGLLMGSMESSMAYLCTKVEKPDKYDEWIPVEYNTNKESIISDNAPDIIVIVNESYYNLDRVIDTNADVDYMHSYNKMQGAKGYAYSPLPGGGTNLSEYELISSNSLSLLNISGPFEHKKLLESSNIVNYLAKYGYHTMAAHPASASNYGRSNAYPSLGFEKTYFRDDFISSQFYGNREYYPTDYSSFYDFIGFYENMPADAPRLAYLLTIQNHGGWDSNTEDQYLVKASVDKCHDHDAEISEYLSCISLTDECIDSIINYFSSDDFSRKVIVCMVGDHAPAFITDEKLTSPEDEEKIRQVPYFIWSNYTEFNGTRDIDMCQLMPLVLEKAGLPICPYYDELLKIHGDIMYLGDNTESSYKDYFLMEYNNVNGGALRKANLFE